MSAQVRKTATNLPMGETSFISTIPPNMYQDSALVASMTRGPCRIVSHRLKGRTGPFIP